MPKEKGRLTPQALSVEDAARLLAAVGDGDVTVEMIRGADAVREWLLVKCERPFESTTDTDPGQEAHFPMLLDVTMGGPRSTGGSTT